MTTAKIRPAQPGDEAVLLGLVRELAEFEALEHLLVASEADYTEALFGSRPSAGAFLAEEESTGDAVGYAIWFENFSSFLGTPGVYLEDIYVQPKARGTGLGKALLRAVATLAEEKKAGRMEWVVLDWNQRAIDFYENLGAQILDEWRLVRVTGDRIHQLADGDKPGRGAD